MNNSVKMKIKNKEGKEIIKEIEPELYSTYLSIGWEVVKENNILKTKVEDRLTSNKHDESL